MSMVKSFVASAIVAALCGTSSLLAQSIAGSQPNDYGDSKSWLCRPGRHDACDVDLTTTIVAADGALKRETGRPDPRASIDCFYVYPTVSTDSTALSDMNADLAELNVARLQFARFSEQCRLYAPMYRQVTLAAGRLRRAGGAPTNSLGIGYDDVLSAWNYYLQHDNRGRGVVLIGHSQGSTVLLFGKVADPDMTAACTNPAALEGGEGDLHAYFDTTGRTIVKLVSSKPWVLQDKPIATPWVSVPG